MILHYVGPPRTKEEFREANKGCPPPYPIGSRPVHVGNAAAGPSKRARSHSPSSPPLTTKAPKLSPLNPTAPPAPVEPRNPVPLPRRHKLVPSDFGVPYATPEQVNEWYNKFPALSRRNFYLVQRHHATSKHYDLRIQLADETISFAIPRGLVDFPKASGTKIPPPIPGKLMEYSRRESREKEGESGLRLAVETNPHPIGYTLFEGGGTGTTAVWDLGTYKMLQTDAAAERAGAETTDEDDEEEGPRLPYDEIQEDLFYEDYWRASFLPFPAFGDKPARMSPDDSKDMRGSKDDSNAETRTFAIQLDGERYKGIQLRFSRRSYHWELKTPKGAERGSTLRVRYPVWFVSLFKNTDDSKGTEAPLGDVSLLTGRTMDEIKACRNEEVQQLMERRRAAEVWESYDISKLEPGMHESGWDTFVPLEGNRACDAEGWQIVPPEILHQCRTEDEEFEPNWESQGGDGFETQPYDPELWEKACERAQGW